MAKPTKASLKASGKTKPTCIKGTACGFSCISGKYTCSSRILARDAKALVDLAKKLDKMTTKGTKAKTKTKANLASSKQLLVDITANDKMTQADSRALVGVITKIEARLRAKD